MLESLLRSLASAKEYVVTGDSAASNSLLVFKRGGSLLPNWLSDDTKAISKAQHQQDLRARKGGDPNPKAQPKGKAKAKGDKGKKGDTPK